MPRVKRAVHSVKKRKSTIKDAKGYRGARSRRYKQAKEAVVHALTYAYADRRKNKRNFRSLWILKINAATREHGLSYNRFMDGLKKAGVKINRKLLADIAQNDQAAFKEYAAIAKKSLE